MKPKFFRKNSRDDLETVREVFEEEVYKCDWFEQKKYKIKNVIDIGALIGSFTLWVKEKNPEANLISIEPDPESFELLKKKR